METTEQDLFPIDKDPLVADLKRIIHNWDDLDYNSKISYRKLYFIKKFELELSGESSLSKYFEKNRKNCE